MRHSHNAQPSIFDSYAKHEIGKAFESISGIIDKLPDLVSLLEADFDNQAEGLGRSAMPIECVLRCALIKHYRKQSYRELAFHLEDSPSYRQFTCLPFGCVPSKSTLQENIRLISSESWERIVKIIGHYALDTGAENANTVRIDSTVVKTNIHDPTDSSLLYDGIRVLSRLMFEAISRLDIKDVKFCDQKDEAKRLARQIIYAKGKESKKALYKQLLLIADQICVEGKAAYTQVELEKSTDKKGGRWLDKMAHYHELLIHVIDQTTRRVIKEESVPSNEKLVSLFEPHSDIIIKGGRDIQYGRKVNITTGVCGIVLDASVETGNANDSDRFMPMVNRIKDCYGNAPDNVAADAGYASFDNIYKANSVGVERVCFQVKGQMTPDDMDLEDDEYEALCNFRAGIESNISELKRAYGLSTCKWKNEDGFKACFWSAIASYNLVRIARMSSG